MDMAHQAEARTNLRESHPRLRPAMLALLLATACGSESSSEPQPTITPSTDSTTTDTTSMGTASVGIVVIDVTPDSISAPWTLSGPDGYGFSAAGDTTLGDLEPGDYTVVWGEATDWTTPSTETQPVAADTTVTFTGVYVPTGPTDGPRIDAASGEVTQGAELQLTGEGFGVKDPVAPVLFDDFENGTVGIDQDNRPSNGLLVSGG